MPSSINTGFATSSIRPITTDAPWRWLTLGAQDLKASFPVSVIYGVAFVVIGIGLSVALWPLGLASLIPVLAGGFFIFGPLLAAGLYDISRRLERNERISLRHILEVSRSQAMQLLYMGFVLMFFCLAWLRIATLLYAVFAHGQYAPLETFIAHSITTLNGLALISVGTLTGAILCFVVFTITAVSIPMILDRSVDFVTAIATSIDAVRQNFVPMVIWAWVIVLLIGFGLATMFLGLVIVFPLVGHATWHAYRDLVGPSG